MDISVLQSVIPADLADHSRVWIYQSNRPFIEREEAEINEQLHQFYSHWEAHGAPVKGWAKLLFRQFIVIIADETNVQVSGCGTDASVRVVKSIELQYEVNMFDRMMLTFLVKGKAEMLPLNQIPYAIEKGYISTDTPMFNNLVNTKVELMNNWLIPIKDSWLAARLAITQAS